MSTLEMKKEQLDTNPMMVAVLPEKVWEAIVNAMHAIDDVDLEEQKIQRDIGVMHYLFNEWEKELIGGQKIMYGENYYGWDKDTLVNLKVAIRNTKYSLAKLLKEEECLPDSVREEYDSIRVE